MGYFFPPLLFNDGTPRVGKLTVNYYHTTQCASTVLAKLWFAYTPSLLISILKSTRKHKRGSLARLENNGCEHTDSLRC